MRVKCLMVCGLLICSPATVIGQEPTATTTPDLELLEFLGSWETQDGQWIDPLELAEPATNRSQTNLGSLGIHEDDGKGMGSNNQGNLDENEDNFPSSFPGRDVHE